ncbi:MAG: hypothetical protein IJC25_04820 [Clostridia bacterium]|nr:hypothetical protein [Clostridia bacterium]
MLAYELADGSSVVVRPSGTEPKLKLYLTVKKATQAQSDEAMERFCDDCAVLINTLAAKK